MIIEKYMKIDQEIAKQLINATINITNDKTGDNAFQKTKVYLIDEYAVLKMQNINFRNVIILDPDLKYLEMLAETLWDLKKQGVNVVPILAFCCDENGEGFIIQQRAKGLELYEKEKSNEKDYILNRVELLSNAPLEHFNKFVSDTIKITKTGVLIDFIGKDNFFYCESVGFQFIDLNAHYDYIYGLDDIKPLIEQVIIYGCFLPCWYDTVPQYRDTVSKILSELTESEHSLLKIHNRSIFEKCKASMINNGISQELIDDIIANERFIPQLKQLI